MDNKTLENTASILTTLLPILGTVGIWIQFRRFNLDSRLTKLDFIERVSKMISICGNDSLKKLDLELVKDELFFFRTGMSYKGRLRVAFTNKFEELAKKFAFQDLQMIRMYFTVEGEKLIVKPKRTLLPENIFFFVFWGLILLMLILLLILSYLMETPEIARFVFALLIGFVFIFMLRQVIIIKIVNQARSFLSQKST